MKTRVYNGYIIESVTETILSSAPGAKMFGRTGQKTVKGYRVEGLKNLYYTIAEAKTAIDRRERINSKKSI